MHKIDFSWMTPAIKKISFALLFFTLLALSQNAQAQWTLVWSDEFNGAAGTAPDSTKWTYDTGVNQPNNELENYTNSTQNSYMDGNGHLVIQALDPGGNNGAMGSYTSARLKSQGLFDQAYGMIECSMQLPAGGPGIWPAFWMLGENIGSVGWPACGEIDMMEDGLPWSNTVIGEHVHGTQSGGGDYNGGAGVGSNITIPSGTVNSGFHTYGVTWSPNWIQFFVDGVNYQSISPSSVPGSYPFNHPFFLLLNLAIGGPSGSPTGSSFPQQMLVDYVRVYKLTNNGTTPYGGTAATVPGLISAANYDSYNDTSDPVEPGEGFAYNAKQTNNISGQYRTGDAISIEPCSDAGGVPYDVDYTSPGQWLQYTINATTSGAYNLDVRVASSGQGGSFHFDLDGNTVTGELTCPNTGGWQNWTDVTASGINITAGQHTLLLVEDTMGAGNAGVCNFHTINLTLPNPPTATPTFTPVVSNTWRVVAGGPAHTDCNSNVWAADENFTGGTAAVASTNTVSSVLPCSTDQALYQNQRYGTFSYSFNVPAGNYQVTLKFAETYSGDFANGDRVMNVSINGTQVLTGLDVYASVGGNVGLDKVFNNIAPSGGVITISFAATSTVDTNADVSAIQIIPEPATPTPTWTVPACTTSSNTFGNTAAGTGGYNQAGLVNCARATLSQPLTVTSMQVYMGAGTSGNGVLGIYADGGGVPGGLLVASNAQVLSTGWNYFVVPPIVLPAGSYWLSGSFSGNAVFEYSSANGGQMNFATYTYTGGLPNAVTGTTGYGWLMSIYASGCAQPTVTPTRSATPMTCGNSTTVFIGSDNTNMAWTNCNAPTATPPADGGGNAWNSANYNPAGVNGWIPAEVINSLAGGWAAPCSMAGSGLVPNWISVIPSASQGNGPCNGTNGQLYYYTKTFTLPAGTNVSSATMQIAADDGTSGGGTEPFGLYVNGNAVPSGTLIWSSCNTVTIPGADFRPGNNIVTFVDENESGGQGIAYQLSMSLQAPTCSPTNTATNTQTSTPSATMTSTVANTNTMTATPTNTMTNTAAVQTNTPTETSTDSPVNSSTPTLTWTNTSTSTSTGVNTATSTSSPTVTSTGSFTPVLTSTPTMTSTPLNTATSSSTSVDTSTATMTQTLTSTASLPPSFTPTMTSTTAYTATRTSTSVNTGTSTMTNTSTPTRTSTPANIATSTSTSTPPNTPTPTLTSTATHSLTPTATFTGTPTSVKTATPTPTFTSSPTKTLTPLPSPTVAGCAGFPVWNGNFVAYTTGEEVSYNGEKYQCIQGHTSEPNWMPPVVPALWKDLGACGSSAPAVATASPVVYPNPATGDTANIALPAANATNVSLEIFTISMRAVQTLTIPQVSGTDMIVKLCDKAGIRLANGLYYFRIKLGGQSWTVKVLVLR